jgi:hypothetical protein
MRGRCARLDDVTALARVLEGRSRALFGSAGGSTCLTNADENGSRALVRSLDAISRGSRIECDVRGLRFVSRGRHSQVASPLHDGSNMNSTSLETIDHDDLHDISGGFRPTWIAEQAINGAIVGGTLGATGGFAAGAFAGSIVPGLGTAAGAGAGTLIGGINGVALGAVYGGYQEFKRQRRDGDTTP